MNAIVAFYCMEPTHGIPSEYFQCGVKFTFLYQLQATSMEFIQNRYSRSIGIIGFQHKVHIITFGQLKISRKQNQNKYSILIVDCSEIKEKQLIQLKQSKILI